MYLYQRLIFSLKMKNFEIRVNGYELTHSKTWSNFGYSRLAMLTREGLQYKIREDQMDPEVSSIWIEIGGRGRKKLILGGIYREHRLLRQANLPDSGVPARQTERWKTFIRQWKQIEKNNVCIVIGDTNLDCLKWNHPDRGHEEMTNLMKHEIETLGYNQVIQNATRFWPNTDESLIDQIWTNRVDRISNIINQPRTVGDHNLIGCQISLKDVVFYNHNSIRRNWKTFSKARYLNKIENIDWSELYAAVDVNCAYGILEHKIREVLDSEAKMTTIQSRKNYKNWVGNETKRMMDTRDKLRQTASTVQDPASWKLYHETRNRCTKLLNKDKTRYHKEIFEDAEANHDTKTIHRKTKNLLGWDNRAAPDRFQVEGRMEHRPQIMADMQMEFFSRKIKDLRKTLPARRKDPMETLKNAFRRWKYSNNLQELSLKGATEIEILKMLSKMNNSTSFAIDELDACSVKIAAKYLYKPLTFIVNLSLNTGTFANKWKIAKLVPIFKGKGNNRHEPNSFRPVSLLPVVAKLTE